MSKQKPIASTNNVNCVHHFCVSLEQNMIESEDENTCRTLVEVVKMLVRIFEDHDV